MNRRRIEFLLLAMLAAPVQAGPPIRALHPENPERAAFKAQVSEMLRLGKFDELERTGQNLIAGDARYSSGVSKLVDLYAALEPTSESGTSGPAARMAAFRAWAQAKPTCHWPKVGLSKVEIWLAVKARGNGVAGDVSPHMKAAMEWARKALADDPRDPQLLTEMIGMCGDADCPKEEADRWLASAIAMNPGYDSAYITLANTLDPHRRRSSEELVAFAEKAADGNKALGDIAYARIASVGLLKESSHYRETFPGLKWERIQSGLREIDRRFPDSARTYHLLALFARVYEDHAVALEAMTRLGTEWDEDAAQYWDNPMTFEIARQWAFGDAAPVSLAPPTGIRR